MLVDECVHGHEFERGDAERFQVSEHVAVPHAGKLAAIGLGDGRMQHRVAAHVRLVEDRLPPGHPGQYGVRRAAGPADDALRHMGRAVQVVRIEHRVVPGKVTGQRLRIRVEQQLGRIATPAPLCIVRAVHAIAVALSRTTARKVAVPD